jgi:hypothetical protein
MECLKMKCFMTLFPRIEFIFCVLLIEDQEPKLQYSQGDQYYLERDSETGPKNAAKLQCPTAEPCLCP